MNLMILYLFIISICYIDCCVPDKEYCKNNSDCCNESCMINSVYGGKCTNKTEIILCMDPGYKCDDKYHPCCGSAICNSISNNHGVCCIPIGTECIYDDDTCCGNNSICSMINNSRKCVPCSRSKCDELNPCCNGLECYDGICDILGLSESIRTLRTNFMDYL